MDTSVGIIGLDTRPREGRVYHEEVTAVMARVEATPEVARMEVTSEMAREVVTPEIAGEVVTPEIARMEAPTRHRGRNSEVKDAVNCLGGPK